jgi:hypothetical protein
LKINQFSFKIKSGSVAHLDAHIRGHVTVGLLGMPHFANIENQSIFT